MEEEVLPEAVNALQKYFEETYPECEVEVQFGGQRFITMSFL